jgi:hypothetical protein
MQAVYVNKEAKCPSWVTSNALVAKTRHIESQQGNIKNFVRQADNIPGKMSPAAATSDVLTAAGILSTVWGILSATIIVTAGTSCNVVEAGAAVSVAAGIPTATDGAVANLRLSSAQPGTSTLVRPGTSTPVPPSLSTIFVVVLQSAPLSSAWVRVSSAAALTLLQHWLLRRRASIPIPAHVVGWIVAGAWVRVIAEISDLPSSMLQPTEGSFAAGVCKAASNFLVAAVGSLAE